MPRGRHILIVDDNVAFAENLAEILTDVGAAVTRVSTPEEALAEIAKGHFSVLVTDMRMPTMSGAELIRAAREIDPGLPALLISAYTEETQLVAAQAEGLLAVLPKPVPLPQLLHALRGARRNGVVVVVEDDRSFRENLTEILRNHGYSVVSTGSVDEVESLKGSVPFAAIVDLRLPGSPDGAALFTLRRQFGRVPLIVVSGLQKSDLTAGVIAHFIKPFAPEKLLEALDGLHETEDPS